MSGDARTSVVSHATLSSGVTFCSHTTGMPPESRLQSGVKVRTRETRPASTRVSTMNSVADSSITRSPRCEIESPVFIDTPLPLSRRQLPPDITVPLVMLS